MCYVVFVIAHRSVHIVKTEGLWNLVELQAKLEPGLLPPNIRRGLYKGFILAGNALQETEEARGYFERILKPVQLRFKNLLCRENFNRIYKEEYAQKEMIDIIECFIGIAQGTQMNTVQPLFDFLSPILSELPVILTMYNDYQVIVQLILEVFGNVAKHMLCYLTQADTKKMYESTLAIVESYAKCNANRFTAEVFSEECSFQDLLLVIELLTSILSKDCLDLCCAETGQNEVEVTAADVSLFGLNFIMPLMTIDLLKYPALCQLYYRFLVLLNDIFPEKIANLPDSLFDQLLSSVQLGLTQFTSEITQSCLDFVQSTGTHIFREGLQNERVGIKMKPFLKTLMDLTLSHQINSDIMTTASTAIFALICSYPDEYRALVENLIQVQTDTLVADRLATAFNQLMQNVPLNCERSPKLKFRDNFEKFISHVHGFLLVK